MFSGGFRVKYVATLVVPYKRQPPATPTDENVNEWASIIGIEEFPKK